MRLTQDQVSLLGTRKVNAEPDMTVESRHLSTSEDQEWKASLGYIGKLYLKQPTKTPTFFFLMEKAIYKE